MSVRDISAGKTWITAVALPPVGMVLLWLRRRPSVVLKLLASVGLVILSVMYLFAFFGMRVEMDGSGTGMIVSFGKPEKLQDDLEAHRAKQKQMPGVQPVAATTPTVSSEAPLKLSEGAEAQT